jgi:putative MATE family efflux protein
MGKKGNHATELGTEPIGKLLLRQSVPAGIGILVMSINMIVDTIFVGQWIGPFAIAAITVVLPIAFFIASVGMAIGVGGGSIISRALGGGEIDRANKTFGNMISLTVLLSVVMVAIGLLFHQPILSAFGAKGNIMPLAETYFTLILPSIPLLAWAMMSNNVIRAEGEPRTAMLVLLVPAFANILMDILFIKYLGWGMAGAAWATSISYASSGGYALYFFLRGNSELKIKLNYLRLKLKLVKEIAALGSVTLARQGVISLLSLVLNNALFKYGGSELYVSIYGIISRVMMFGLFPVLGVTQGFLPIAGFNYGAKQYDRVRKVVLHSIGYGTLISIIIYALISIFEEPLVAIFTDDPFILKEAPGALLIVFFATPVILAQLVGAAYFQAIGQARPALLLTLTKQGFFLIPLVLILPHYYGVNGIWYAFPIADILSTIVTAIFLTKAMKVLKVKQEEVEREQAAKAQEIAAERAPE